MGRTRAAYMREYRARKRMADLPPETRDMDLRLAIEELIAKDETIAELEAEVARLKREIAVGSTPAPLRPFAERYDTDRFSTRPFTPVPKKR